MWKLVGWLLVLVGILAALGIFTGLAPVELANLGVPLWAWLVLAAFGGFIVMLNRRPNI